MAPLPHVTAVEIVGGHRLRLTFDDGVGSVARGNCRRRRRVCARTQLDRRRSRGTAERALLGDEIRGRSAGGRTRAVTCVRLL